jgi:hypothetical protein
MSRFRQPLNPVVQNALIMLASGVVASVLCAKVYGATLPVEEPAAPAEPAPMIVAAPEPQANDAAAAAQLRAMVMGKPALLGQPLVAQPRQ